MTTQQEMDDAIALAMQTARTEALIEAEKVVRDRITLVGWAADARSLRLAADAIARLPRRV